LYLKIIQVEIQDEFVCRGHASAELLPTLENSAPLVALCILQQIVMAILATHFFLYSETTDDGHGSGKS